MPPILTQMSNSPPHILCLHGGGTSAAIFRGQTRKVRSVLGSHFNFHFVDAPIEAGPGPGVLPYFEDSGPFFRWFSDNGGTEAEWKIELDNINKSLEMQLTEQGRKTNDISGLMSFSQGTVTAALLLHQARSGNPSWKGLRFAILFCGGSRVDVFGMIREKLRVPSVHLHGLQDPWVAKSRMLTDCFHPDAAVIMEFDEGHCIPTKAKDIERIATLTIEASQEFPRRRLRQRVIPSIFDKTDDNHV